MNRDNHDIDPPGELVTHLAYRGKATLLLSDERTAPAVWRLPVDVQVASWSCRNGIRNNFWDTLPVTPELAIMAVERHTCRRTSGRVWSVSFLHGMPAPAEEMLDEDPRARPVIKGLREAQGHSFNADHPPDLVTVTDFHSLAAASGIDLRDPGVAAGTASNISAWAKGAGAGVLVTARKDRGIHPRFKRGFFRVVELTTAEDSMRVAAAVCGAGGRPIDSFGLWIDPVGGGLSIERKEGDREKEWWEVR